MINILLDEAINGYTVSLVDTKTNRTHTEIAERYVDALSIIKNWIGKEFDQEVKRIHSAMQVM